MKVVILCDCPLNIIDTGSKIYLNKLTGHLSHISDMELHILTDGKKNRQFKSNSQNIHVIKRRKLISILYFRPLQLWKIKREIAKIDPNVVHAISSAFIYSPAAAFLRDRYPTVLTIYGIVAKEAKYVGADYEKTRRIWFYYIYSLISIINERYLLSKIPNTIVESLSIKDLVKKWTKSKIYVVPAGIEYNKIKVLQSNTLSNDSVDIFIVVNLEKIKGVDILINAVSSVIRTIPNLSVYIAGIGPQEIKLKQLVKRLNLEDNVKFLGFISEEEKYQYYKSCKIVVVPSRWDCQPFALYDAAASGKPVIASDMSNPGIVDDGISGLIFKSENVGDLANKIITLLKNNKLREEMGTSAKEKMMQYDWSKIAERYVEIYNEVIADFHRRKNNK